tara:strand:- start:2013 stop:3737 length:1725 start_codon:yes stop_codon:yes gene_type:complete
MTIFYQEYRFRIIIVFCFFSLLIATIVGKLFYIHIIKNDYYENLVNNQFLKSKIIQGSRGFILDRNGENIAKNKTAFSFLVDTNQNYDKEKILNIFSKTFQQKKSYYENILAKKSNGVVLESNVPLADCRNIVDTKINGLSKFSKTIREYPYNELAAQVIGYTDSDSKGVSGVEKYFDNILKGEIGKKKLVKNINGYLYENPYEDSDLPQSGSNITLSLDMRLQEILQDELLKTIKEIKAESANGVILNPFSGEILAMANVPSLDLNNYFNYDISYHQNRTVIDSYEPGSTFKSIAIACGIEESLIHENDIFDCENGSYYYFGKKLNDHIKHDDLTVAEILMHSSNVGISKIVDKNIGLKLIYKYSRDFGYGNKTGIYLPGEAKGLLKPLKKWRKSSGTFVSMGQEVLGSTLQTAMAYSVFANGGYLLKPQILKNISGDEVYEFNAEPFVVRKVISENTATRILRILEAAVDYGSGKEAGINGYKIAGKTGTSQTFKNGVLSIDDFIASFAGIFPSNEPKYVCVVAIKRPTVKGKHWGGIVAAPIIRNIFARVINEFEEEKPINYNSLAKVAGI